jgi:predicted RNA-binding protein with PIN domain
MIVLIDGYNLLYAAGVAGPTLRAARGRLLDWLATAIRGRGATLRVIFDAQDSSADSPESDHRGVRVRFAFRQTADDLIEEFLAAEPQPQKLTVVSNDSRLHASARRYGCRAWSCQQFMDWLNAPPAAPTGEPLADEKAIAPLSAEETEELMRAFTLPRRPRRR